ncbi:hypothetical protein GOP47_0015847 [Adiantum capillus-veneris]|uniref:Uncharacterized protein n=1 Tax=Adiantum capillus-veneris TaxID=13818 RepID=A0A9D4UKH8_ADICA|nr:hypothetical protein GOP47_0015847 [Adiantum capillus-veneris]
MNSAKLRSISVTLDSTRAFHTRPAGKDENEAVGMLELDITFFGKPQLTDNFYPLHLQLPQEHCFLKASWHPRHLLMMTTKPNFPLKARMLFLKILKMELLSPKPSKQ